MSDTYLKELSEKLGFDENFIDDIDSIDDELPEAENHFKLNMTKIKSEIDAYDLENNLATWLAYDNTKHGSDRPSINFLKANINDDILSAIERLRAFQTKHELNYYIGNIQGMITVLSATEIISPEFEKLYQKLAYEVFINCGEKLNSINQLTGANTND